MDWGQVSAGCCSTDVSYTCLFSGGNPNGSNKHKFRYILSCAQHTGLNTAKVSYV